MVKERHQLFRSILIATDALCILAAQLMAYGVRFDLIERLGLESLRPDRGLGGDQVYTYGEHSIPLILLPVVIVAFFYAGLYRPRRDQRFWREAIVILRAVLVGTILVMAAYYVFQKEIVGGRDLSRLQFGLFCLFSITNLLAWRIVFRAILRTLRRKGWNLRHVAIIGTGRLGQVVYHTLRRNKWTGITPACFVSHKKEPTRTEMCGLPVVGGIDDIEAVIEKRSLSGVFVAVPQRMAGRTPRLLSRLERFPIDVRVVPDVNPRYTPFSMTTTELDGMPILAIRESPMMGWGALTKRTVDLIGACVGIAIFAIPMIAIAIAIRCTGKGPIVFRQPRASLGGKSFVLFKFRTMNHVSQEQQSAADLGKGTEAWTEENDPRITRLGKFLRRTSLDELPQLFNVLIGEMSLVGPRPERPELIARFKEDWRGYMLRQHVKAGMTGWAQVNGLRGRTSLKKRLQYDLFYIRNWSLIFDLRILWLTIFKGFVHPNAQ